jgi:hypothetical protein
VQRQNQKAKGKRQKAKMKTVFSASFLHFCFLPFAYCLLIFVFAPLRLCVNFPLVRLACQNRIEQEWNSRQALTAILRTEPEENNAAFPHFHLGKGGLPA